MIRVKSTRAAFCVTMFALTAVTLTACEPPPLQKINHIQSSAIVTLNSDGGILQEMCDGHSNPRRWDGEMSFVADMMVYGLPGGLLSQEKPILKGSYPVGHGLTVSGDMQRAGDSPLAHEAVCHGSVMRTVYHYEHDRPFVDWWLIMAPSDVEPYGGAPFAPKTWSASGRIPIDIQTGRGEASFLWSPGEGVTINGVSSLKTVVKISPGPQWVREYNRLMNKQFESRHSDKAIGGATPLPDEEAGRTLSDDMEK